MDVVLLWLILGLPFFGSLVAALLPSAARNTAGIVAALVALSGSVLAGLLAPTAMGAGILKSQVEWLPTLGMNLVLRLDGLSWLFAMMVLVIGLLVVIYARYYMSPKDPVPRFFAFLLAFMGSMLGLVLSGNLIQLVFFWELTSLFSFLLIGYWHQNETARTGARMALIVTATGGFSLLLGVLVLGRIVGSYDLDAVLAAGALVKGHALYAPALALILIGAFTKSAQVPLHFWLPHAMAAPTPVSAYLHSATMVKAGIFVLLRLWPVLAGTGVWHDTVTTVGLATLLIGAWAAMFQQDLKGLLAYSTISHLGLIMLLLGLGTPLGAVAAIFHTLNHATFKASLFMAVGIIDHEAGTRDVRRLSGLFHFMPITATLAMVAAAAMAGVPLLNGFLSKEMFLAEAIDGVQGGVLDAVLPVLATVALTFSVLYSVRFIHQTFFGPPPKDLAKTPREAPFLMRFPIGVLVLCCIVIGVVPALAVGPILDAAARATLQGAPPSYSLAIWHGWNAPLLLSLFALVFGVIGYIMFRARLNAVTSAPLTGRFKGRRNFEASLAAIIKGSRLAMNWVSTPRLQPQLRVMLLIASLAVVLPLVRYGYEIGPLEGTPIDPSFAVIWLVGCACAIGAAWTAKYRRLTALILISGAGLVSCISFIWLSAPDLAITQLLVETVTTVLLLLGLRWLPQRRREERIDNQSLWRVRVRRGGDFAIAITAGIGMGLLSYAVMTRALPDVISSYFIENSYAEAGGRNAVNVTLVDFRAFDTLGEISVLAVVALTIFSLLRKFRPAVESIRAPEQQRIQAAFDARHEHRDVGDTLTESILVPRVLMEWLFPAVAVVAAYLLIRGHDLPGGGFAAGVTMSIALTIQYMASGTRSIEARLHIRPLKWIAIGLLVALATGAAALAFGHPFLTSWFRYAEIPVIGAVPLATAMLFDIGVFALVVGTTALILIALAHQSIRTPRRPAASPHAAAPAQEP